ncbi:MAG: NlpC/P60 family protein [Actinobacteria bacterium]|nr:NlpC/P60 family protein [Actinomycetota bacterium]
MPPELPQKQSEAERIKTEIEQIDMDLEPVINDFNRANIDLEGTRAEIADNTKRLQDVEAKLAAGRALLNQRVAGIYRNGSVNPVQVFFGSKSFDELVRRLDMLKRIGRRDATIVREVLAAKREVEQRRSALQQQEKTETAKLEEISQKKAEIEGRLTERNAKLSLIKDEIAAIERAEAERSAREAEELRRRLEAERAAAEERARRQAAPSTSRGDGRSDVVEIALRYLGIPYVYGGADPSVGFDCSGFTMYVYRQVGIGLPHYVPDQYGYGAHVSRVELQPGDLVFFNNLGHVGIYVGNDQYIHAPNTGSSIRIDYLSDRADYVGATRL